MIQSFPTNEIATEIGPLFFCLFSSSKVSAVSLSVVSTFKRDYVYQICCLLGSSLKDVLALFFKELAVSPLMTSVNLIVRQSSGPCSMLGCLLSSRSTHVLMSFFTMVADSRVLGLCVGISLVRSPRNFEANMNSG